MSIGREFDIAPWMLWAMAPALLVAALNVAVIAACCWLYDRTLNLLSTRP